jgi:hypothetical protein
MNKIKFLSLFLFHSPLHHLPCKYGAPKQAKHEQMYLGLFQDKILFQNKFLFLFCPPLKYFSFTHLLTWANSEKIKFLFLFFSHPPLKIFQNSSALINGIFIYHPKLLLKRWMVMLVGFDNLTFFWWFFSYTLGDGRHHQSLKRQVQFLTHTCTNIILWHITYSKCTWKSQNDISHDERIHFYESIIPTSTRVILILPRWPGWTNYDKNTNVPSVNPFSTIHWKQTRAIVTQ